MTPPDSPRYIEETVELTVIADQAGVDITHARQYVEFGLFGPSGPAGGPPRFHISCVRRVARAERLRHDFELNYAGAVLASELLDRIAELEQRLR